MKLFYPRQSGFTLIEFVVATALFLIVLVSVSIIFVRSLRTQRVTASLMEVNNNVSLALEQIAREIRTGSDFCAAGASVSCTSDVLVFTNARNQEVVYRLAGDAVTRSVAGGSGEAVTANDTVVERLVFIVSGEQLLDGLQPRVTIRMGVRSADPFIERAGIETHLQTTVSARSPEL